MKKPKPEPTQHDLMKEAAKEIHRLIGMPVQEAMAVLLVLAERDAPKERQARVH